MLVIGIGHRAQQGKSLFSEKIVKQCERVGISCGEYSFSDAIIDYCIETGALPANTHRSDCDPNLLVKVSKEKREADLNFWVNRVRPRIEAEKKKVVIVPNIRFPQELRMVKEMGGVTVRVRRKNANGTWFISPCRDANDPCENSLDFAPWNFEIVNMASRPFWLRKQAVGLLSYLLDGAEGETK
jgi:hypothetical protein